MKFALFTTAAGNPILIGEGGIIIEPEPGTGRSNVIMQHNQRDGKSRITVTERFEDIVASIQPTLVLSQAEIDEIIRRSNEALRADEEQTYTLNPNLKLDSAAEGDVFVPTAPTTTKTRKKKSLS